MTLTILAAVALLSGQGSVQPYAGTWTAELAGKTFVRLEFDVSTGVLAGKIGLGDIHLNSDGNVDAAQDAPGTLSPLFDITLRESVLTFSRKDGDDTDRFEMRLLKSGAAELRFLPVEADLRTLADAGIAAPKPVHLKKTVP